MYSKSDYLPQDLRAYMAAITPGEPEILRRLREETASHPHAGMQIPPEQGHLLALLARAAGTGKALEIGVFTGYSSLAVALQIPDDARITALDVSEEYTAVARRYWREARVDHKIDLRIAPALDSLAALVAEGREGTFDFAFIDADKGNYDAYYESSLKLLRPGGLMALDNMLFHGKVQDPANSDPNAIPLRKLNAKLKTDPRALVVPLAFGDGVTVVLKKETAWNFSTRSRVRPTSSGPSANTSS